MPARCSVRPLRLSCMRTIAAHYDLLCYGCRTRHQMAALLEAEADQGPGYQDALLLVQLGDPLHPGNHLYQPEVLGIDAGVGGVYLGK